MGLGFFGSLIVGGLAGWFASMFMKADTGLVMNIVLGIIGAALLNFILWLFGIYTAEAWLTQLIVGFIGASLLIAAARRFGS